MLCIGSVDLSFGLIQSQNSTAYIGLASGAKQLLTTEDLNEMKVPYLRMVKSFSVQLNGGSSYQHPLSERYDLIGIICNITGNNNIITEIMYLPTDNSSEITIATFIFTGSYYDRDVEFNSQTNTITFESGTSVSPGPIFNVYLYKWTTL